MVLTIIGVSCIPSLYPLYREKDLLFDERLAGSFDFDGDLWEFDSLDLKWQREFNNWWDKYESGKTYKLTAFEDDKKAEFAVHLIKLNGNYFLQ